VLQWIWYPPIVASWSAGQPMASMGVALAAGVSVVVVVAASVMVVVAVLAGAVMVTVVVVVAVAGGALGAGAVRVMVEATPAAVMVLVAVQLDIVTVRAMLAVHCDDAGRTEVVDVRVGTVLADVIVTIVVASLDDVDGSVTGLTCDPLEVIAALDDVEVMAHEHAELIRDGEDLHRERNVGIPVVAVSVVAR
jgi:hypothetical protein